MKFESMSDIENLNNQEIDELYERFLDGVRVGPFGPIGPYGGNKPISQPAPMLMPRPMMRPIPMRMPMRPQGVPNNAPSQQVPAQNGVPFQIPMRNSNEFRG